MYDRVSFKFNVNKLGETPNGDKLFELDPFRKGANSITMDSDIKKKARKNLGENAESFNDRLNLLNNVRDSGWGGADFSVLDTNTFTNADSWFSLNRDGEVSINLLVSRSIPNSFKFFSMNITEDLDVIIPGAVSSVKVLNLKDYFIKYIESKKYPSSVEAKVVSSFSEMKLRQFIEDFKFGKFDLEDGDEYGSLTDKSLWVDRFLDYGQSSGDVESIILYFLTKEIPEDKDLGIKSSEGSFEDMKVSIGEGFVECLDKVLSYYRTLSFFLVNMQELFSFSAAAGNSEEYLNEVLAGDVKEGDVSVLGRFSGFRKAQWAMYGILEINNAEEFFSGVLSGDFSRDKLEFMGTMFEVDVVESDDLDSDDDDYLKRVEEEGDKYYTAASIMDFLRFKDEDLAVTGVDPEEEGDLLARNLVTVFKQKFRDFYSEAVEKVLVSVGVRDESDKIVSELIPPEGEEEEYVLGVRGMLKAGRLFKKVSKNILDNF